MIPSTTRVIVLSDRAKVEFQIRADGTASLRWLTFVPGHRGLPAYWSSSDIIAYETAAAAAKAIKRCFPDLQLEESRS